VRSAGPPPGWTGKVATLAAGVAAAGTPEYLLFTDADIRYTPGTLRRLVAAAPGRVLVSQMALLRSESGWERLVVPAFVYFFAQLYPFAWVNGPGRTAAAAGGCVLVRRAALERAGGLATIRDAVIDDVSLARRLKPHGRIWLGLSPQVVSVRPYPRLADLWRMVARSAYTQLRYSPLLLLGTVLGLIVTYAVPPALLAVELAQGAVAPAVLAGLAYSTMALTFAPMLRFYRLSPARALLLPMVALLYLGMTLDSARRHRSGHGTRWKGRIPGDPALSAAHSPPGSGRARRRPGAERSGSGRNPGAGTMPG
jgi:hopene-associated glycosyltransferase HpnB